MKTKKKRMTFSKETISNLNVTELSEIYGAYDPISVDICGTVEDVTECQTYTCVNCGVTDNCDTVTYSCPPTLPPKACLSKDQLYC
jgi:hypothetical protein